MNKYLIKIGRHSGYSTAVEYESDLETAKAVLNHITQKSYFEYRQSDHYVSLIYLDKAEYITVVKEESDGSAEKAL